MRSHGQSRGKRAIYAAADPLTNVSFMEVDYDEFVGEMLAEAIDGAVAKLTTEQRAELAELQDLGERMSAALNESAENTAGVIVRALKDNAPAMLEHRRREREDFEKRLAEHWGRAFDLSEMVMKVAHETGEFFYEKHVPPDGERDFLFEALGRLLARACRIAEEVLVLMKAGYGQAALARWRALHEVAVVAQFLLQSGAETAECYFEHEAIETWRAMQEFQKHAERLGETPYSDKEVTAAQRAVDELIQKYGPPFRGEYGWAQDALAGRDAAYLKKNATLPSLEEAVGAAHFRPHYRMASHGVHANPKGVTWTPDLLPSEVGTVLLTGPSRAGLADAGHATFLSLTTVTEAALVSKGGIATVFIIEVMRKLTDEAGEAYIQAHRGLVS